MNMSYCRFQNTSADLRDCMDALDEMSIRGGLDQFDEPLSDTEEYYADFMYNQAKEYIQIYENYLASRNSNNQE